MTDQTPIRLSFLAIWIASCALICAGCDGADPSLDDDTDIPGDDDDDDTGIDDDDDTGDDDDDSTVPDPVWNCAEGLSMQIYPVPLTTADTLHMDITQATGESGHVYVDLSGTDPHGSAVSSSLDEITGQGPWTWWYTHGGLIEGRYDWVFTADSGDTWLCDASVWVGSGGTGDDDDDDDSQTDDDDDSGGPPPDNPFGIGLVSEGNSDQWNRTAELAGRGGHIKLIFAGVERGMTGPQQSWIDAVDGVYARDLVPVIRMGPAWGSMNIRDRSDDGNHMNYTTYAAAYAAVVDGLPLRAGWPLVVEVHNEPNLCYEWECTSGWLDYTTAAAEYAAFLRDVTDAIDALGDSRIKVINGGYAPGGVTSCECGGSGYAGGITSREFIAAMESAVPGVHAALDGFATHSYPSAGEGYSFFQPYSQCHPGLHYWETELSTLGINKSVYITETGWPIEHSDCGGTCGSREDIAGWMLETWQNDWYPDSQIEAVMPFILQDGSWNDFAWVDTSNNPYPVFTTVRDWRCSMSFPDPC